jgi:uncharacterized protein YPO0396
MMDARSMPSSKTTPSVLTADEVPVTRAMLAGVRTELLERIDQGRAEAKADNQKLEAKIDAVHAELHEMKAEMRGELHEMKAEMRGELHEMKAEMRGELHEMRGEIHRLDASIHEVEATTARIEVLVEEQNARNKMVLDGITALLSRQNQVEERMDRVEDTVRALAAKPRGA